MIWNSSPDLPDLPSMPEVSHLLQFGTSSTRAGGQDDVSSNQLPQNKKFRVCLHLLKENIYILKFSVPFDRTCWSRSKPDGSRSEPCERSDASNNRSYT